MTSSPTSRSAAGARTPDKWEWYGYPAHFICANDCRFRLATLVGNFIVSTVGDLYHSHRPNERQTLGAGDDSFFETYVFSAGSVCKDCPCGEVRIGNGCEIEGIRAATAKDARENHMRMCRKYSRRAATGGSHD